MLTDSWCICMIAQVNEEVKAQLTQVLEFLKGQQTRADTQKE